MAAQPTAGGVAPLYRANTPSWEIGVGIDWEGKGRAYLIPEDFSEDVNSSSIGSRERTLEARFNGVKSWA